MRLASKLKFNFELKFDMFDLYWDIRLVAITHLLLSRIPTNFK